MTIEEAAEILEEIKHNMHWDHMGIKADADKKPSFVDKAYLEEYLGDKWTDESERK